MKPYIKNLIIALALIVIVIFIFLLFKNEKDIDENLKVSLPVNVENVEIDDKYDDVETIKKEVNSSSELVAYLSKNYSLEDTNNLVAKDLEVIVSSDKLNLADFSYLSSYLFKNMGLEPGVIRYEYGGENNLVVVFRDKDAPKYITFTDNGVLMFEHGWSFEDLIKAEENRLNIVIDRYAYFPEGVTDFSRVIAPYDWQDLN
ncbi:MAG: hypothetical protein K9M44_04035 [Candidatus Pacebacteria bacterium]|nr:hypothetical protein [Candidatus Paceibacterota bacterium]